MHDKAEENQLQIQILYWPLCSKQLLPFLSKKVNFFLIAKLLSPNLQIKLAWNKLSSLSSFWRFAAFAIEFANLLQFVFLDFFFHEGSLEFIDADQLSRFWLQLQLKIHQ